MEQCNGMNFVFLVYSTTEYCKKGAGDATKEIPPNCPEFEECFNNSGSLPRAHGRTGPNPAVTAIPDPGSTVSTSSLGIDTSTINALLTAVLVPTLTQLAKNSTPRTSSPSVPAAPITAVPAATAPSTSYRPPLPCRPDWSPSSHPETCDEITNFLAAFAYKYDININGCAKVLAEYDWTPDVLFEVPLARLVEVLVMREGSVMKMQRFAKKMAQA